MQNVYSVKSIGFVRIIQGVKKNSAHEAVIAATSSRMGSVSQNSYAGTFAYRATKATRSFICKGISDEYQDKNAVVVLHPGRIGSVPLKDGMRVMLNAIQAPEIDSEFRFINYNAELIPW